MNPTDNIRLAKFLNKEPKDAPKEAANRCACGRAYYAAHAIVRDVLMGAKMDVPASGKAHGRVIDLLKSSKDSQIRAAGNLLDQLRATRQSADYHVGGIPNRGTPFDKRRSALAVWQAETVVDEVERARQNNKRLFIAP